MVSRQTIQLAIGNDAIVVFFVVLVQLNWFAIIATFECKKRKVGGRTMTKSICHFARWLVINYGLYPSMGHFVVVVAVILPCDTIIYTHIFHHPTSINILYMTTMGARNNKNVLLPRERKGSGRRVDDTHPTTWVSLPRRPPRLWEGYNRQSIDTVHLWWVIFSVVVVVGVPTTKCVNYFYWTADWLAGWLIGCLIIW